MAAILPLSEDFETGPAGATIALTNTIFDNISGLGGDAKFTTVAYAGTLGMAVSVAAGTNVNRADTAAVPTMWVGFYFRPGTPGATPTAIFAVYSGITKVMDVRWLATGELQLRSVNTERWTSIPLAVNEWHRVAVRVSPTAAGTGVLRLNIYSGTNRDGGTPSQSSGDQVASAAVASTDNVRLGALSSDTLAYTLDRLRADDANEPAGVAVAPPPASTTVVAALTEDFETGPAGATITTANSIFDSVTGAGVLTFVSTTTRGLAMRAVTAATAIIARADFPVATTIWFIFELRIITAPAGGIVTVMSWYSGTTKVGDLRINTDRSLQLRDGLGQVYTTPAVLAVNIWHRIAMRVVPGSTTGHRLRVYEPVSAAIASTLHDSGDLPATASTATTVDNLRMGVLSLETCEFQFNRVRGDTTVEPAGEVVATTAPVVTASADQSGLLPFAPVTVTASATGGTAPYTFAWSQSGGLPVVLTGTGASRTLKAPAHPDGGTSTLHVTATDNLGVVSAPDSVVLTTGPHDEFLVGAGGALLPVETVLI